MSDWTSGIVYLLCEGSVRGGKASFLKKVFLPAYHPIIPLRSQALLPSSW